MNLLTHGNEIIKTIQTIQEPTIMDKIINLLDVVIWPIALVVSLILFKKNISKVLNSLGSIKAGAQGVEINFIEEKLEEATKMIGIGSSGITAKDSGSIIPKSSGGIIPKSSENIIPEKSQAESPYQGLMELQDAINNKLTSITTAKGLATTGSSNFALTNDLANRGIIDKHTASKLKTLIELNTLGLNSPKTTHEQVTQMKKLFNNISF